MDMKVTINGDILTRFNIGYVTSSANSYYWVEHYNPHAWYVIACSLQRMFFYKCL